MLRFGWCRSLHELSVAMSLVDIACEELTRLGARRALAITVQVGPLSGVVPDALTFAFDEATRGTPLEGARLDIDEVAAVIYCDQCDAERELPSMQGLVCPNCGAPALQLVRGRELALTALEIDDDGPENR